jgi:hypothetical protein
MSTVNCHCGAVVHIVETGRSSFRLLNSETVTLRCKELAGVVKKDGSVQMNDFQCGTLTRLIAARRQGR